MMNISICYTTKVIISYDSRFNTSAISMSLEKAIAIANAEMRSYGFTNADIIDAETDEILAILENED